MNRTEVLQQLEPITHTQVRQVEHGPRTRVVVTPDMVVLRPGSGGHLIPLNENGVKALTNYIGMPRSLCQQLSPDTFGRVVTELLDRKQRYNILLDNGQVIDFADYRGIRNLPTERVVETIERSVPSAEFHRVNLFGQYSAMIEVVGEQRQPVVRGDLIRAGALVTFSPINTIRPTVQSYVLRLACTNGMTANNVLKEFQFGGGGEGDDIWQWFRQSLRDAYRSLNAIVNRYREMRNERIPADQRAAMLEAMLRDARITGEDADAIRARAIEEPPRNTYDLVNLLTWASSHVVREPARIRRIQTTVATFSSEAEHRQVCPICHRNR